MKEFTPYLPWTVALAALTTNFVILGLAFKDKDKLVSKDICKILTGQYEKNLDEVKLDLKELLKRIPAKES